MKVAQHRNESSSGKNANAAAKRKRVEVQDVAIVLKKNYGITIPGLSGNKRGMGATSGKVGLSTARVLGSVAAQSLGGGLSNGGGAIMNDMRQMGGNGVNSSAGNGTW